MINNMICVSDLHCGDQLGLCPKQITLTHGGKYHASKYQLAVLNEWNNFWDEWVPRVTRGEDYAVLINGDALDGVHHGATHQISHNKADQQNIASEILSPIIKKCGGRLYYVSGTAVHAGESGVDEEKLAQRIGAIPDRTGNSSRYELYIEVGSSLVHASHHIGVTGSMSYETTALTKEYNEFCSESARWGRKIPNIIVRSHRHRHSEVRIPTSDGYGIIFVTSSWQLKTPFIFRTPGGRVSTPTIGGSLIRAGDEETYTRHYTVQTDRPNTEIIPG